MLWVAAFRPSSGPLGRPSHDPYPKLFVRRAVRAHDRLAIAALHGRVMGRGGFARTAYRVREGGPLVAPYCRIGLLNDRLVATPLRFTEVSIGGRGGALLLGPLAVDPALANRG